jgi:hypothetical protein
MAYLRLGPSVALRPLPLPDTLAAAGKLDKAILVGAGEAARPPANPSPNRETILSGKSAMLKKLEVAARS